MPDRPRRVTILIADDDAANRMILRTALERAGYAVVETRDGAEAIGMISRVKPDLAMTPGLPGCALHEIVAETTIAPMRICDANARIRRRPVRRHRLDS